MRAAFRQSARAVGAISTDQLAAQPARCFVRSAFQVDRRSNSTQCVGWLKSLTRAYTSSAAVRSANFESVSSTSIRLTSQALVSHTQSPHADSSSAWLSRTSLAVSAVVSATGFVVTCESNASIDEDEAASEAEVQVLDASAVSKTHVRKNRDPRFDTFGPIIADPDVRQKIDEYSMKAGECFNSVLDTGAPQQITAGFTAGFAMGYAAKKSAKVALFVIGILAFAIQFLAFSGYVKTDWEGLSEGFVNWLDSNGDGKIDSADVKIWWEKFCAIAGYNLPAGSGWVSGIIMGFRAG